MWKTKLEAFSALILLTKNIYVETVCVRIDPAQIFVDDATYNIGFVISACHKCNLNMNENELISKSIIPSRCHFPIQKTFSVLLTISCAAMQRAFFSCQFY